MDAGCDAPGRARVVAVVLIGWVMWSAVGCRTYRMAMSPDPLSASEHINLGVAYEHQSKYALAIKHYQIALDRDHPRASFYLANALFLSGDADGAGKHYRNAITRNPEDPLAYNNLAWLYLQNGGDLEQAELLARRAIVLNGEHQASFEDTLARILEARD